MTTLGFTATERRTTIDDNLGQLADLQFDGPIAYFLGEAIGKLNKDGSWDKRWTSYGLFSHINNLASIEINAWDPDNIQGRLKHLHNRLFIELQGFKKQLIDAIRKDPSNLALRAQAHDQYLSKGEELLTIAESKLALEAHRLEEERALQIYQETIQASLLNDARLQLAALLNDAPDYSLTYEALIDRIDFIEKHSKAYAGFSAIWAAADEQRFLDQGLATELKAAYADHSDSFWDLSNTIRCLKSHGFPFDTDSYQGSNWELFLICLAIFEDNLIIY